MKNCPVKTTTLKARINKVIGKVEKTDWSFITSHNGNPVDDKVITYFSKGVLEPSYLKGFTQEEIDGYKSEWVAMTANPRGSSPKTNKITYNDIVKEIIADMTEQDNERRELGRIKNFITYRDVPRMVLAKLRKYEIVCGRYKARDLVDTVMNRYEFSEFVESFEGMCSFLTK